MEYTPSSWATGIFCVAILAPLQSFLFAPLFLFAYRFAIHESIGYWRSYKVCLLRSWIICGIALVGPFIMSIGIVEPIPATIALLGIILGIIIFYGRYLKDDKNQRFGVLVGLKVFIFEILVVAVLVFLCSIPFILNIFL